MRQPDAARGHAANFWYEATLRGSKRDMLRRVLFAEQHPVEKLKRIALGPLTLEGLPQGRYRSVDEKEVRTLQRALTQKHQTGRREEPGASQRDRKERNTETARN